MIIMITTVLYLATEGINENRNIHINDKSPNSIGSQRATKKYLKINHNTFRSSANDRKITQNSTNRRLPKWSSQNMTSSIINPHFSPIKATGKIIQV